MDLTVVDPARLVGAAQTIRGFHAPEGLAETDRVLFVPVPSTVRLRYLDNLLQATAPDWALRSDVCVLGVHPGVARALADDPRLASYVLNYVALRVERAPVYVLAHDAADGVLRLRHGQGAQIEGLDDGGLVAQLRHADLTALLNRAGAHLPASDVVHYEGPNGRHYRAFIRPGFSLRTTEDLDRVAFWLAPHLIGRDRVLVDHWSMIALAHHTGAYTASLGRFSGPVSVETVHSYGELRETLTRRLGQAFDGPSRGRVAALVSATSSGELADQLLLPALLEAGQEDPVVVSLAHSPGVAPERSHLLDLDPRFAPAPAAECVPCVDGNSVVVPIQPDTYLLALTAFTQKSAITAKDTADIKPVVERYAGTGLFSVHRDHHDGGINRHHAYHIDLSSVLESSVFQDRLDVQLASLRSLTVDVIVHPRSSAATRLAELVAERLRVDDVVTCYETEMLRDRRATGLLAPARTVLVVDDVTITGRRLLGYRRGLIALRRSAGVVHDWDLHALVGVARPQSATVLRGVGDIVHHRDRDPRFHYVEKLFLPNWGADQCSWCRELRALENLPDDLVEIMGDRMNHLRQSAGLTRDLFASWPPGEPLTQPSPDLSAEERWLQADPAEDGIRRDFYELGPHSVFGEVQDADLAVSVAAAVQMLRSTEGGTKNSRLDDHFRPPVSKVLDPALYLLGRFYEPVLVAAILRACRPFDLRAPGETDLVEGLEDQLRHLPGSHQLIGEMLVQAATGNLPLAKGLLSLGEDGSVQRRLVGEMLATPHPTFGPARPHQAAG